MRLLLLSESADWKLDVVDSYKETAQHDTDLYDEYKSSKGDEVEFVTYLAFLESASEFGLKVGTTVRIELIINKDTGVAWIDWLGSGPNRHNEGWRSPGYIKLRQLLSQIADRYPSIRYFTGHRISGMREKHPNNNQGQFKLATSRL